MKKKLTKIFSINFIGAGLNFITTILVVKLFGLEVFGEFAIILAYIGLFTIMYIIIPPSYATFKIQDDESFQYIFFYNYIIGSIFIVCLIYIVSYMLVFKVNIFLIILFSIMNGFMNYFDVYLKAYNKLEKYFMLLLISYIIKMLLVIYVYIMPYQLNLNLLLDINILSIFITLLYGFIYLKPNIKLISIFKYINFLKVNFYIIKSYYVNIIFKRLKDNMSTIIFSYIVSSDIIGLYNLFTRISMFVLGQLRVIEAYFMNRENLKNIRILENKKYFIGLLFQLLIILIGLIYLKLSIGKFYLKELFIYSFLVYPYINIIVLRNKFLSSYQVNILNQMYLIYLFILICFYFLSYIYKMNFILLLLFIVFTEYINILFLNIKRNVK